MRNSLARKNSTTTCVSKLSPRLQPGMTLDETQPRDLDGKFGEKLGAKPEVKLPAETPGLPPLDEIQLGPDNVFARKYDTFDEKTQVYVKELESAVAALENDEGWQRYLDALDKSYNYSFSNQMLIAIQSKDTAELCMSAKRWGELGRHPRKGSTGYRIQAPVFKKIEETDANGNVKYGPDGKPLKREQLMFFKSVPTFDIKQTDGEPLELNQYTSLSEEPPAGFTEDLESAITGHGFKIEYVSADKLGSAQGATSTSGSKVVKVREDLAPAERARTLAHELGHIAAGHVDKHDDYHSGDGGQRGAMEVEAESISYVLMRANGMQAASGARSGKYVAGWASVQKDDPKVVEKTAVKITGVIRELLGKGSWQNTVVRPTAKA